MHCHGYPEISLEVPNRFNDEDTVRMMHNVGMGGVVFKSHFWPTITTASCLDRLYTDFPVFSSITLNPSCGGVNLWVAEAAVKQGVKVFYLPTWGARHDQERKGTSAILSRYVPRLTTFPVADAFCALDSKGRLSPVVLELLEYMKEQDTVLCTGHIAPQESLAIAKAAKKIGFSKLVITHPNSGSIRADVDQIAAMAKQGAYIELCALGLSPVFQWTTAQKLKEVIHRVGAAKCILTTGYAFEWSPSAPEQMRLLVSCLLLVGVGKDEISIMIRQNPRLLLGMDDHSNSSMTNS